MKMEAVVRNGGPSMSLTGAVKTIWSDTDRVSYDVVLLQRLSSFHDRLREPVEMASACRLHAVCTVRESLPQTMA
jgi:hypothetical protein